MIRLNYHPVFGLVNWSITSPFREKNKIRFKPVNNSYKGRELKPLLQRKSFKQVNKNENSNEII